MGNDTQFQLEYAGHLAREVLAGRMTRRELLMRAAVVGLSATLVGQVLAACGARAQQHVREPGGGRDAKEGRHARVRLGLRAGRRSTRPSPGTSSTGQVIHAVFESLYRYAAKPGEAGTDARAANMA